MDESKIRALIREEAVKLIREQLTIHLYEENYFDIQRIRVEVRLCNKVVSDDFTSLSINRD